MNKINPTIKRLINISFHCETCDDHNYCEFWKGYNPPCDCCEGCFATETADGMQIAFDYLVNISRSEALEEIMKVGVIDKSKNSN